MEFTVNKQDLATSLYKAQGVVDKKSALNILSHVLIETTSNTEIRFTCTDYDVVLTGTLPAEVSEPGKIAVGAKNLYEVVRALPEEPVHISRLENDWISLRCGSANFRLAGLPADDFPEQTDPGSLNFASVPKQQLLDLIDRTLFSVSHDESRASLNGVLFEVTPSNNELRLLMVSTDGHRLSKSESVGGEASNFDQAAKAIIHRKAISELKRCLEDSSDMVQVAFERGNIYFGLNNTMLQVRELEETFPDYSRVIPEVNSIQLSLNRIKFQDMVRRIATLTSSKTHILRFEIQTGKLVLRSSNPEAGEGWDELAVSYEGEPLSVGFNYRYLLDILSVIDSDQVTFSINDQYSPGLLTTPDDDGSLFVVMPMRI
jgi:DNA polymerase-3 subunit beta